jgi:hypothetical protein
MRYFTDLVGGYVDGADHDVLRGIRDLAARRWPVRLCSGYPLADGS